MAQSTPPSSAAFPLPVATVQTARSLMRLHQYLRGELLKREDSEDLLVAHEECHQVMGAIGRVCSTNVTTSTTDSAAAIDGEPVRRDMRGRRTGTMSFVQQQG